MNNNKLSMFNKKKVQFYFLMIITSFLSCNDCSSTSCENGTCLDGSCVCEAGYYLNNGACIYVSNKYVGSGNYSLDVSVTDNNGTTTTEIMNLLFSTIQDEPKKFTISNFNGIVKNDIVCEISDNDNVILESNNPVSTSSGLSYNVSGGKSGSNVTLTLEQINGNTYVLNYFAP